MMTRFASMRLGQCELSVCETTKGIGTYIQRPGVTMAHVWSMVLSIGKSRTRRTALVTQVLHHSQLRVSCGGLESLKRTLNPLRRYKVHRPSAPSASEA